MDDSNFRNHLAFLANHRGQLREGEHWVALDGEAPFLSFFAPTRDAAELPAGCAAVWTYPWAADEWPRRLARSGFAPAEQLAYMRLDRLRAASSGFGGQIERIRTDAGAEEFARVQASGFLAEDSPNRAWWADCFQRKARENHARPDQQFLLARIGHEPAAVLLTVESATTVGIYAVATAPEHRRKGLSTALLARAVEDARAKGAQEVVLQVLAGSYAHGFYRKLGFEDEYMCQVWRRQ